MHKGLMPLKPRDDNWQCARQSRPGAPLGAQLLGLRGRDSYLDPQILAAYEALAGAPIEEGFSARAADGRSWLLQSALEELRRTRGRALLAQDKGIDVEWALLPGALALLQEVPPWLPGMAAAVLFVGSGHRRGDDPLPGALALLQEVVPPVCPLVGAGLPPCMPWWAAGLWSGARLLPAKIPPPLCP